MFCAYTRPRYQVSVYRINGPLVYLISDSIKLSCFVTLLLPVYDKI